MVAGGSKRGLGRPMQTPRVLDLSRLSGVRNYEPNELVLTAGAATPLDEIEEALAEAGRCWLSSRPIGGQLLGTPETRPTLGGALACNLSGPRRIKAGRRATIFSGFARSAGAAKSSNRAAGSSKTSPATISRS